MFCIRVKYPAVYQIQTTNTFSYRIYLRLSVTSVAFPVVIIIIIIIMMSVHAVGPQAYTTASYAFHVSEYAVQTVPL